MTDRSKALGQVADDGGDMQVFLPCDASTFGEFIKKLLGRPQTIERGLPGPFVVSREKLSDVFHLVAQRIEQQNESTLIQFTIQIMYHDGSSVLLDSLDTYQQYNEVRPLVSVGVILSWRYLVKFRNREVFEKQEIDLAFRTGQQSSYFAEDSVLLTLAGRFASSGGYGISMRISHTDRTWGADIESLLSGFAQTLIVQPSRTRKWIGRRSSIIGTISSLSFIAGSLIGTYFAFLRFRSAQSEKARELIRQTAGDIGAKIDGLLARAAANEWAPIMFSAIIFIIASVIVGMIFGEWITGKARTAPSSFVLLTDQAERKFVDSKRIAERDWMMFWVAVLISIFSGVASNLLFNWWFT